MGYVVATVWTFRVLLALTRWLDSPEGRRMMEEIASTVRGLLRGEMDWMRAGYRAHFSRSWRVAELVSRVGGPVPDSSRRPASSSVAPAPAMPMWRSKGASQIRVFVVDDHEETGDNLAKLIGF